MSANFAKEATIYSKECFIMIICMYCGREFKSMQAYYAHKCEGYVKERLEEKRKKEEENENGEFICNGCGKRFKTIGSLRSHARFCENYVPLKKYDENGKYISNSKYKIGDEYICECGKTYTNPQSFNAHLSHCDYHHECTGTEKKYRPHEITKTMCGWENKSDDEVKEIRNKSGRTYSKRLKTGELKGWLGRKHTELSKQHHREAAIRFRETMISGCRASYNKTACEYIDKLNKRYGWHLQHALNGGEVKKFGYYLDGYDEELNIVFEYDESKHYADIENNILKEKDLKRQNYIMEHLNCRFFRYNEKMDLLYEVE